MRKGISHRVYTGWLSYLYKNKEDLSSFQFFGSNLPAAEAAARAHAKAAVGVGTPAAKGETAPATAAATPPTCPCLVGCRSSSKE